MPLTFQTRPLPHRRKPRPATPPPSPPALDVILVGADHGSAGDWYLYWVFTAPLPPSLTLADVAGLTAGGVAPVAIDSRADNWVMLRCPCQEGVGGPWLVAPGGSPIFVPGEAGVIQEI